MDIMPHGFWSTKRAAPPRKPAVKPDTQDPMIMEELNRPHEHCFFTSKIFAEFFASFFVLQLFPKEVRSLHRSPN